MDERQPWWLRLLDGGPRWGSFRVIPSRYGITHYRLVVFPPGIGKPARRRLRAWRTWPVWGGVLWLVLEIWLTNTRSAGVALAISTAVVLAAGGVAMAAADDSRTRVRTLSARTDRVIPDTTAKETAAELHELARALTHADDLRDQGQLTPAQYEALWWQAYDQVADRTPAESR